MGCLFRNVKEIDHTPAINGYIYSISRAQEFLTPFPWIYSARPLILATPTTIMVPFWGRKVVGVANTYGLVQYMALPPSTAEIPN
ncbi:hypothetical protein I7I48_08625 [Histoplasma ohiense]|nr:hypothetical protein I7I48_08625 [Histoplasma ohiense (nom. inval.)]